MFKNILRARAFGLSQIRPNKVTVSPRTPRASNLELPPEPPYHVRSRKLLLAPIFFFIILRSVDLFSVEQFGADPDHER